MAGDDSLFAFDKIVLIFPNNTAAESSQEHISELQSSWNIPSHVEISVTSDPYLKMGSGGGTIAALAATSCSGSILIIHAGGESSRCPSQMILGKAWTSLPSSGGGMTNPIASLVRSLSTFFGELRKGSVVVVSSDSLLSLPSCEVKMEGDVLGVGVPVPLETAVNHGVYVCENSGEVALQRPRKVLQKPSVREMESEKDGVIVVNGEKCAWIDTGIVVFLPHVVQLLRELSMGELKMYTEAGIESFLDNGHFERELRELIPPIDIYTHVLQAINCTSPSEYLSLYPGKVFKQLLQNLNTVDLSIITVPQGEFCHLGTTHEFMDFLTRSDLESYHLFLDPSKEKPDDHKRRRCHSFLPFPICHADKTCAVTNTLIEIPSQENASLVLEDHVVMEHCHILPMAKIQIKSNSFLSCIRGSISRDFTLGEKMHLLQVAHDRNGEYIFIALGIDDEVKGSSSIFNIPLRKFLKTTGLSKGDLWEHGEEQNVWNAKLHPVITCDIDSDDSMPELDLTPLQWILDANKRSSVSTSLSFKHWVFSDRLSLSQIQSFCQHKEIAEMENHYRHKLYDVIPRRLEQMDQSLSSTLMEREFKPCFFLDSPDATRYCWNIVDRALLESLRKEQFDITSRCFMVQLNWVIDILELNGTQEAQDMSVQDDFFEDRYGPMEYLKNSLPSSPDFEEYCKDLMKLRGECLELTSSKLPASMISSTLTSLIAVLQESAGHLTRSCVGNTFHFNKTQPLPAIDEYVIASAPARIDVAGGWTDTPPISYEYGGAVSNLAVSIDKLRPFLCKCRKFKGEGLKIVTQGLTFLNEVHLSTVWDLVGDYYDLESGKATLVKSALICLGMVPLQSLPNHRDSMLRQGTSVQPILEKFLGEEGCGLEIITMSDLPQGSGMGGSSILGGCILAAIGRTAGMDTDKFEEDEKHSLLHSVLALEQIMTSGGGWQDQVGGIMPGFKITKSIRNIISPLELTIEHIPISPALHDELTSRLVLVFTGKARIAKNILQNVLRRWSRRSHDIMQTVQELVQGAEAAADAIRNEDVDELGRCIKDYWEHKKIMTGGGAVEPPNVKRALDVLYEKEEIVGATLCGAGGGGFLLLLAREGRYGMDLETILEQDEHYATDFQTFTWHECTPQTEGLSVQIFNHDITTRRATSFYDSTVADIDVEEVKKRRGRISHFY